MIIFVKKSKHGEIPAVLKVTLPIIRQEVTFIFQRCKHAITNPAKLPGQFSCTEQIAGTDFFPGG